MTETNSAVIPSRREHDGVIRVILYALMVLLIAVVI